MKMSPEDFLTQAISATHVANEAQVGAYRAAARASYAGSPRADEASAFAAHAEEAWVACCKKYGELSRFLDVLRDAARDLGEFEEGIENEVFLWGTTPRLAALKARLRAATATAEALLAEAQVCASEAVYWQSVIRH